MSYLVYCILRTPAPDGNGKRGGGVGEPIGERQVRPPITPSPIHSPTSGGRLPMWLEGVAEQPVVLVAGGSLSAAASRFATPRPPADIACLEAYAAVVEALHRQFTVIPMRYGCVFGSEAELARALRERQEGYQQLLRDLDGCAEMGIRALLTETDGVPAAREVSAAGTVRMPAPTTERGGTGDGETGRRGDGGNGGTGYAVTGGCRQAGVAPGRPFTPSPPPPFTPSPVPPLSGRGYLAARMAHYAREERDARAERQLERELRSRLHGCFVRAVSETRSVERAKLVSLYFLVPWPSVEAFRERFRETRQDLPASLLLSGPWPPYNFVRSPDTLQGGCASAQDAFR